jgi:bifunctional DNA-binding transcriptional regulator/antitoxin component of YhaV-PrlF toxin-antitoxin module
MPRTVFVKIYQSKGNSDTMAVVIPKELRKTLKLKKGDTLQAKVDYKNGLLIYSKK